MSERKFTYFLSWAKNAFSYIHDLPRDNLNIIFDNYGLREDPTKVSSKGRVDWGYERTISSLNQALLKLDEWQDFFTNNRNKEQLCSLLADYFISDEIVTGKTIYITKGSLCLMKTLHNGQKMVNELCSNHKEADHSYAQSQNYSSTLYGCFTFMNVFLVKRYNIWEETCY